MVDSKNTDTKMAEDKKRAVFKELLSSSNKDEDEEVRKKKADDFAWAKRKRDAMFRDLLSRTGARKKKQKIDKEKKRRQRT